LINDESSISLPMNWFCDVTTNNGSVIAKTYFTLILFQMNHCVKKKLKHKLDLIIEDKNWDCEDIFLEHDYTKSSVFECVVYYLGG